MDFSFAGLPVPVAFAAVAVLGYLVGRRHYENGGEPSDATRRELKRAQAIVQDLEKIGGSRSTG